MANIVRHIHIFLRTRFSLHNDKEDESEIIESIRKGIEFRGINVWILIFAIFLASIGLNVNSTAVIIGAMLISPLMGPIMGIGLSLGIFDFEMLKLATKNLAVMVIVSLTASTLYFALSPLSEAQSELLSRTTPTIWDVLIALFGGLAGIMAGSSKSKGNVIPGVAIATALMPPLCTAGFGIASGDFYIFLGAFYLFCINSVFISVTTIIVVRLLKFKLQEHPDRRKQRQIRNLISIIVLITIVPSVLIAYLTVKKELFEQRASAYIKNEFVFEKTLVLTHRIDYENLRIDVVLMGDAISKDSVLMLQSRTADYKLGTTDVHITQGIDNAHTTDLSEIRSGIVEEVYSRNQQVLDEKDKLILDLQSQIVRSRNPFPVREIGKELKVLNPEISYIAIERSSYFNIGKNSFDTITLAQARFMKRPSASQTGTIERWLKERTKSDSLLLIIQ